MGWMITSPSLVAMRSPSSLFSAADRPARATSADVTRAFRVKGIVVFRIYEAFLLKGGLLKTQRAENATLALSMNRGGARLRRALMFRTLEIRARRSLAPPFMVQMRGCKTVEATHEPGRLWVGDPRCGPRLCEAQRFMVPMHSGHSRLEAARDRSISRNWLSFRPILW